jgi:hypothetical protein
MAIIHTPTDTAATIAKGARLSRLGLGRALPGLPWPASAISRMCEKILGASAPILARTEADKEGKAGISLGRGQTNANNDVEPPMTYT